jgi:hypothetical protein
MRQSFGRFTLTDLPRDLSTISSEISQPKANFKFPVDWLHLVSSIMQNLLKRQNEWRWTET